MAAINGFNTTAPDARYGDTYGAPQIGEAFAQKFTLGGTGTQRMLSIGFYGARTTTNGNVRLAIFTHDAANDNPDAIVTDSDISKALTSGVDALHTLTYVAQVDLAPGIYWIAICGDVELAVSRFASGGTSIYKTGLSYPTWPTASEWDSATDLTRDFSLFVAHEDAPVTSQFARPNADVLDGSWTNQNGNNVNLYMSVDEDTASDLDYIQSGVAPSNDTCLMTLGSIDPPSAGTVTLRVRAKYV
jgi:hypothetical protein